jgi:cGMP-dependent protein kinase
MATLHELKGLLKERTKDLENRDKLIEHLEKELDKKDATIRHLTNEIDKFRQVVCPLSPRPERRIKRQAISAEPPEGHSGSVGQKISKSPK